MCLACAVPVRGAVYGSECLAQVLGEEPRDGAEVARDGVSTRIPMMVAFAVALASTALPWTTFGEGSGPMGAWGRSPRWAMVAALAALLGLVVAIVANRTPNAPAAWNWAAFGLGILIAIGATLEWFRPPFPSRPSIVPWVAAAAGLAASAFALRSLARETRSAS